MTSRLVELAERVEKLAGSCRETDALIYQAVTGNEPVMIIADSYGPDEKVGQVGFADGKYVRRFTGSLDAAMTLVPEGWFLASLGLWRSGAPTRTWAASLKLDPQCDESVYTSNKPSAAIALCLVALRARAASEPSHGG